jgi:mannose-1-phosphate guanylyltransferase
MILAGGDGTRLLPLTRKLTGDERPKQFCNVVGDETLLDQTRRRVDLALRPMNSMFVLTQAHERYYRTLLSDVHASRRVIQPRNAGTTPAILYSLLRLQRLCTRATVAFFPSDHYFSNGRAFMDHVDTAFGLTDLFPELIFLLGIKPDDAEQEYGWIETAQMDKITSFRRVQRFWEKPAPSLARELMRRGCLWNSFVMVGKMSAFIRMIGLALPDLYSQFDLVRSAIGSSDEEGVIRRLYENITDSNFSSEVLTTRTGDLATIPVSGTSWSDLGTPRLVMSALSLMNGSARPENEAAGSLALAAL